MTSTPDTGEDSADDASVIARSRTEPGAFAALFDRYGPDIHRYLARRLGPQAADDLVGETFLVAFRKRAAYDQSRANARPWLYGIATNLISEQRRQEVRDHRLLAAIPAPADERNHADRVAEQVTAQALSELLNQALAGLSAGDRDVLVLVAWEGLTYEQVANALEIPVGTVRSRLNRARRQVRAVLEIPAHRTTVEEGIRRG